jgi:sigma-E factor negative regulatory protein RseB
MTRNWPAKFAGILLGVFLFAGEALATDVATEDASTLHVADETLNIAESVQRMHQASLERSYTGTFVVLSASGQMASSRIWHACKGGEQIERIDVLGGAPRTVFRRKGEVRTFVAQTRTVHIDHVGGSRRFPFIAQDGMEAGNLSRFYQARKLGIERLLGLSADVLSFEPKDAWRYGYRIWLEQSSGIALKFQTLAPAGQVMEQAAFLEIDLATPVSWESLTKTMDSTKGYRVAPVGMQELALNQAGWSLREAVPGFEPTNCYRRQMAAREEEPVVQCIYSDGMAAVSMFFEPFESSRHGETLQSAWGATHMLAQRIAPDVWFTAVGEVPLATLQQFASRVQRIR